MASSLVLFGAGLSRRSSDLDRAWTEAARQYKNARRFCLKNGIQSAQPERFEMGCNTQIRTAKSACNAVCQNGIIIASFVLKYFGI